MFKNLSTYLDMYASPDQKSVLMHACQVLADAGYTEHASVLDQDLVIADQMDQDLYLSLVQNYMVPLYRARLGEFGIVTSELATLPIMTSILEGIGRLDNWDDPEAIDDAIQGPDGAVASLADALAVVGADSSDVYLEAMDAVSEDLLLRLREILQEQVEAAVSIDPIEQVEQREACKVRVSAFLTTIPTTGSTLLREYLDGQGRLHESVRNIATQFYDRLRGITAIDQQALEIVSLLSASTLPTDQLLPTTMRLLEQLGHDEHALLAQSARLAPLIKKAMP